MKKMTGLFIILLFLTTGCTTVEFVRKDTLPKKQAIVRYSPTSSESQEAKYKEEVKRQALNFCGTDFEITKEYQARDEANTSAGVGTGFGIGGGSTILISGSNRNTAMYNFVEFVCK